MSGVSYLAEQRELLFVSTRTASPAGILEIQVEAVEVAVSQVLDCRVDELSAVLGRCQHGRHFNRTEVPTSYSQQRLQRGVDRLQVVETGVPDKHV